MLEFTFEKNNCCAKREEKITCREEKSQLPPPPGYQMIRPLMYLEIQLTTQYFSVMFD